jgi:hypothetical protein
VGCFEGGIIGTQVRWSGGLRRVALATTGILGGVLFAAGAGTGISLLITHTYWSAKYTITVTLFALLIAYFSFRMARRALTGKRSN